MPRAETFYAGLILVVLGTGLLKPNISAIVGELYPEGGARRDSGFTIFYMGINPGAFIGPLVCSTLGEKVNWHCGFAAAGVGMMLGLIQYHLSRRRLGDAGLRPGSEKPLSGKERLALTGGLAALASVVGLGLAGVIKFDPVALARGTAVFIAAVAVLYFTWVLLFVKLERAEKQRVGVIAILFLAAALFWAGFEQAGSSFNLFADRYTERRVALFDFVIPAGWFQSLGPVFIITLAPVMAGFWVALARRNLNPSVPVKFACGLLLLGLGLRIIIAPLIAGALLIILAKPIKRWMAGVQ